MGKKEIGMSVMNNNLSLDIHTAGKYGVTLRNRDGHEVYKAEFIFSRGVNHIAIPQTILPGAYFTAVDGPGLCQTQKIRIQESIV